MRWRFSTVLSLVALAGSLGCSSGSSWSPLALGKGDTRSGSRYGGATPYEQSYNGLAADYRSRNLSSPGLGLHNGTEPGTTEKLASTGSSVTRGIKSGWNKTTRTVKNWVTPRKGADPNPISAFSDPGEMDADLVVSIARLEEAKANWKGAEVKYGEALELDPKYLPALLGVGHLHDRQGNLVKAEAYFSRAVETHPKDASAHNDLGQCYARQGRLPEAAQHLEMAIQIAPDKKLYRNNIAKVLVEMGHVEPAFAHLREVHGEAVAHYNVGYLLNEKGDAAGALQHFTLAYQKDQTLSDARDWMLALSGERQPASEAFAGYPGAAPAPSFDAMTEDRLAAQQPYERRGAPPLSPSWANESDHAPVPAAPPTPDGGTGYVPAEPDPGVYAPGGAYGRLPPVDTAYQPPSRY